MDLKWPYSSKFQLGQQRAAMLGRRQFDLTLPTLPTSHFTKTGSGWILSLAVIVLILGTRYMNATINNQNVTETLMLKDN